MRSSKCTCWLLMHEANIKELLKTLPLSDINNRKKAEKELSWVKTILNNEESLMCKSDQEFREKYSDGWDDPIKSDYKYIDPKTKGDNQTVVITPGITAKVSNRTSDIRPIVPIKEYHYSDKYKKYVEKKDKDYEKQVLGITNPSTKQVGGTHYKNMPIQVGEFVTKNNIPWFEANAIKYICRHQLKGGELDLDKAIHYLELAKEYYYNV